MWKLDYEQNLYDQWESSLTDDELILVHAVLDEMSEMSEHPHEFKGVADVYVGRDAGNLPGLYKAHLRPNGSDELLLLFGVFEEPFIEERLVFSGTIILLEYGRLKTLRDEGSIQGKLEAKAFYKLLQYIERGRKWL